MSYLTEVTALLQRARQEHPTKGLWEAADLQWWWRAPRSTDNLPQPFWYDDSGPVAAAVVTEWSSSTGLDVITLPSVRASLMREVFARGLILTGDLSDVEMLVDDEDEDLHVLLADAGFRREPGDVTAWVDAGAIPDPSPLIAGYSLHTRARNHSTAHHLTRRNGPEVEDRLRRTSLYRPELDVSIVDPHGGIAAYGLFWNDPTTGVGLVEPIRTEEGHQGRGLARILLTAGLHRLVAGGCGRIKVSYDPENRPAVALYRGAGFEPTMTSSTWTTRTR